MTVKRYRYRTGMPLVNRVNGVIVMSIFVARSYQTSVKITISSSFQSPGEGEVSICNIISILVIVFVFVLMPF